MKELKNFLHLSHFLYLLSTIQETQVENFLRFPFVVINYEKKREKLICNKRECEIFHYRTRQLQLVEI